LITAVGPGADEIDIVQLVMGESAIDENPPVPTRRIPMGSGVDPSAIAKKSKISCDHRSLLRHQ
jgi:hypothetical protein